MRQPKERRSSGDGVYNITSTTLLIISIIFSFYPFFWMIMNSFKTNTELFLSPFKLPKAFNFNVYEAAWKQANFTYAFKNSIMVTFFSVFTILVVSSLAAYAIARMKFPGNKLIIRFFTASIIISAQVILIPLFYIVKDLKMYDTPLAVILPGSAMGLPFTVFLLWGFFKEIPLEIEESTQIDGCSRRRFFTTFIIPLSKPIISTVVIFQSLWTWNEYMYALTFLKSEKVRTVPLQLKVFFTQFATEWSKLFAALTIAVLPLLIIYILMQKYFIKGLTAGAVKM